MRVVSPLDEQPHPVSPDLQWSEAYYFNFFDRGEAIGGFTRIAIRPNEGAMDAQLSLYLPDGGFIAARHVKPQVGNTAELDVGGVRFTMLEPLSTWRITYDGPAHFLRSARDAGSHEAWAKSRLERLIVDLGFDAIHPPAGAGVDAAGAGDGAFEQAGRLTGEVWVSGDQYSVAGHGNREKFWGVRDLQAPRMSRWFSLNFGDSCAMGALHALVGDSDVQRGWIYRDGRTVSVDRVAIETESEPDSFIQKKLRLTLTDVEGGRHEVSGEVLHVAPIPAMRNNRRSMVCEGLARWVYEGETGYGIAQYVHQLDDHGLPMVPVK